jgi:hypothetical protein
MSDPTGPDDEEPVGSMEEEAAKLFAALQDWAITEDITGADRSTSFGAAAAAAAAAAHRVDEHIATGGPDCRYCPVCQVISAVRGTPPEVRQHLVSAATSLMHAVTGLLATPVPDRTERRDPGERVDPVERIDPVDRINPVERINVVEKIDLDDDWEDD